MTLPNLADLCVEVPVVPQDQCVTLPGGVDVCVQLPSASIPDPLELAKQLLAQVNSALAPLTPVFNIIDAVLAVKTCIEAIPDSLGPPPNPTAVVDCLEGLVKAIAKLLAILPPLSFPLMIVGIIDAIILVLEGIVRQLEIIIRELEKIAAAGTRAAELGATELERVIDCAEANCDVFLKNLNEGLKPLNRLFGVVNAAMGVVGLGSLPNLDDLGDDPSVALDAMRGVVDTLKSIRAGIPV